MFMIFFDYIENDTSNSEEIKNINGFQKDLEFMIDMDNFNL